MALGTYTRKYSAQVGPGLEASERFTRSTLEKYALRSVVREVLPQWRCAHCGRFILPGRLWVSVRAAGGRASVNGLAVCGSVWVCPVCSSKVSEHRRQELRHAIETCQRYSMPVALLTLTLSHHHGDKLSYLLLALRTAWRGITQGRTAMALKSLGLIGWIRSSEFTTSIGDEGNGWHPHFHVLLVLDQGTLVEPIAALIAEKWRSAIARAGLPGNQHAVDIRVADSDIAAYISKYGQMGADWDVAAEMAKSHVKHARSEVRATPFDLLRRILVQDGSLGPLVSLFREYAEATKGMHQLHWSHGLRAILLPGVEDMTDEEIAERAGEDMPEVARLTQPQWSTIYRAGLVGRLLVSVAQSGGDRAALSSWLEAYGISGSTWVV